MTVKSPTDLPDWLPASSCQVLAAVHDALDEQSWLVVGALARDHAFSGTVDLAHLRATMDVDLAVRVESWDEFRAAIDRLQQLEFSQTPVAHRLQYANSQLVDVLPFGAVEENHHIAWPPDNEPTMNVLGFQDVFAAAETVDLPGGRRIRVASLAGVAVLKIVAWHDNPTGRRRDLEDLAAIINGVIDVLGWDLAHEEFPDILNCAVFDFAGV